jgi:hypothetical protein
VAGAAADAGRSRARDHWAEADVPYRPTPNKAVRARSVRPSKALTSPRPSPATAGRASSRVARCAPIAEAWRSPHGGHAGSGTESMTHCKAED